MDGGASAIVADLGSARLGVSDQLQKQLYRYRAWHQVQRAIERMALKLEWLREHCAERYISEDGMWLSAPRVRRYITLHCAERYISEDGMWLSAPRVPHSLRADVADAVSAVSAVFSRVQPCSVVFSRFQPFSAAPPLRSLWRQMAVLFLFAAHVIEVSATAKFLRLRPPPPSTASAHRLRPPPPPTSSAQPARCARAVGQHDPDDATAGGALH